MPAKQVRNICFTLNNWTPDQYAELQRYYDEQVVPIRYIIFGRETAPETGTPHLQGYCEFLRPVAFSKVHRLFFNAHIEPRSRYSTSAQAAEYCKKDDTEPYEAGEMSKPGARTDLDSIRDQLLSGDTTVDDIAMENPTVFHQYGRTLERIQTIALRRQFRTEMTQGYWYFGKSGQGKSHTVFHDYDPSTHYIKNLRDEWWDGYNGQPIVIFDEFRGQIPFGQLLTLADKWPLTVKQRHREPVPFLAKEIRITSCLRPERAYANIDRDEDWVQFTRRFHVQEIISNS